jgi:hypothetical protein
MRIGNSSCLFMGAACLGFASFSFRYCLVHVNLERPNPSRADFTANRKERERIVSFDAHLQQTTGRRRGQGTSSKCCLLVVRPGQAEGVCKGGRGSQGFCGLLREDGWRRESSCVHCTGGIPKRRSTTRGASIPPTNSSVAFRNPLAVSLSDNSSETENCCRPNQPSRGRSAASRLTERPGWSLR